MTDLSTRAQGAIEALQEQTASEAERARVRARLASMGIVAFASAAGTAVAGSAAAATLGGASATPAAALSAASSAGVPLSVGAVGVAAAPAASSLVGASVVTGAAGTGSAALGATSVLAKLAGIPLALKTGALVAVVAGAGVVALPDAPPARSASHVTQAVGASSAPVVRSTPAAPTRAARAHDVPMLLEARSEAQQALEPSVDIAVAPPQLDVSASAQPELQAAPASDLHLKRATAPASVAPSKAVANASEAAAVSSTLAAESGLLASALRALRAGQNSHAAQLLDQHEHTFGTHAQLARERERMRDELSQTLR